MAYIGKSPTGKGVRSRFHFTATGSETSLSGADDNGKTLVFADGEYVDVYVNGVLLFDGDYNTTTANTIGGLAALSANDVVEIVVYDIFSVADTVSAKNGGTFSGDVTVNGDLTVDTDTLYVDSTDGNVGIGTTSPNSYSGYSTVTVNHATNGGVIEVSQNDTIKGQFYYDGTQTRLRSNVSTDLTFDTNDTERMRIDSSGNVGIGTSSPTFGSGSGLEISRSGTSTLRVERTGSTASSGEFFAGNDKVAIGSTSNTHLEFRTNSTERMRIDESGNLLIGTTENNPADNDVSGTRLGGQAEFSVSGGPAAEFNRIGASGDLIRFKRSGTQVGSISVTTTSTSYNTSSDHRLKENAVDMTGAITRVKNLQPKRFNFIADDTNTLVDGFMAHEAQTVVPEAVTGTHNEVDDDGNAVYQGIDQSKLVPLLTGALQEAITKIETLETEMTALKARVTTLENA